MSRAEWIIRDLLGIFLMLLMFSLPFLPLAYVVLRDVVL